MNPSLERMWALLPKFVQDIIASTVDRLSNHQIPDPVSADLSKPIRLFIAPANYAGQGFRWARAVERNPLVSARNMVYAEINPFGYDVDYAVRWRTATHSRKWQKKHLEAVTSAFTHVLVEAEFPPLGGMFHENVSAQVSALRDRGVSVAMVCHGSDIRLPSRHRELEPWSPFVNDDWVRVATVEKAVLRNLEILSEANGPTFVSTPGLLLDVPHAHLLPVVIDPVTWKSGSKPLRRKRLKVVHIPSNPLVKGTAEILEPLSALDAEGLIDYEQVTGVTHDQMPAIFADCDIVLDQFRLGDYGVAACEAMASGRLVVSHVSEQARDHITSATGLSLPIVEANIDNIGAVIRDVINRRGFYSEMASRGPSFVKHVHDGRFSRSALERHFLFLGDPNHTGQGEDQ
jgi:hypothetical protein